MRVAYVSSDPGVPVFGRKGASVHVQELVRAYRRLGHDVTLVTTRTDGPVPPDLADVEVIELDRPTAADTGQRELAAVEADRRIERLLTARPDVDLVHERYSLFAGGGIRAADALGRPSVIEVNAPLIEEQATHRELVHERIAQLHLTTAVNRATTVVAVSAPVADWVRERTGRTERVHVVPNGVDVDRFSPLRPVGAGQTGPSGGAAAFTVGFVGTLKPWHGVQVLVEAMAGLRDSVPEARLLLVGDGPQASTVLAAADRWHLDVEHTGALTPDEIPAQLARMDVACAPYPTADDAYFSPLKVLEYLAAGVPVVASDVGQIPQLLDGGRCGELVPAGDVAALRDTLARLAGDVEHRAVLAARGRTVAVERHSWTSVATTIVDHVRADERLPIGAGR